MFDKDHERKRMALRAPTLSDADWSQFASGELARYLADPTASDQASLVTARTLDDRPSDSGLPMDVGMLLGMRNWMADEPE